MAKALCCALVHGKDRVARQRASMMVQQDEFTPDYFTDLISYVTLDAQGKVRLITKTDTVIEEGTE